MNACLRMNAWRPASRFGVAAGMVAISLTAAAADDNEKYALNCLACHGSGRQGVQGLGVNLATSRFVGEKSVAELVAFLKAGRSPGVYGPTPMPAFAWLPEADLTEIATWIKGRDGS
ncbi:MAG: c-type cytochrome [Gammaproteobacteria bacterium]